MIKENIELREKYIRSEARWLYKTFTIIALTIVILYIFYLDDVRLSGMDIQKMVLQLQEKFFPNR